MKRVAVLHRELAPAHDAEARPDLVAELGLDLVKVHGQLPIAAYLAARDIGDHFLVRGSDAKIAFMTVFETQQLRPVLPPAPRLLPQLRGLHRRHEELDRSGAIHFLSNDGLDLANHPQPQRHPSVDSASESADQTRADHQLVTDEFRVSRGLLERCKKVSRSAHSGGASQDATFYLNSYASQPGAASPSNRRQFVK